MLNSKQTKIPCMKQGIFVCFAGAYKPNSVLRAKSEDSNLSSPSVTLGVKRFSPHLRASEGHDLAQE